MLRFAMTAAVVASLAGTVVAGAPKVECAGAREIRGTDPSRDSAWSDPPPLTVVLRVSGLDQPARYGTVEVTEAKDDAGADLKPAERPVGDEEPVEFPGVVRHVSNNVVEALPAFYARVHLQSPARTARKITSLKGEIRVIAGGGAEATTVKIPAIKTLYGKTVSHPDLSRAGVTVQVAEPNPLDPLGLSVMISGRTPRDVSISVVDADGKDLSRGSGGSGGTGTWYWHQNLTRPIKDTDALKIHLPLNQKPLTIPFDLKDIELP